LIEVGAFFFRVVVCNVAEVIIPIHFLVDFCGFSHVLLFEEVAGFALEALDVG